MRKGRHRIAALFVTVIAMGFFPAGARAAEAEDGGKWEEIIETIHHEEEGHYENTKTGQVEVIDREAWDDRIAKWYYECTVCQFKTNDVSEINQHLYMEHPTGNGNHYYNSDGTEIYPSYREDYEIEIIHHEAETHMEDVYEDVWVVDREAYDDYVHTGIYRYTVNGETVRNSLMAVGGITYYFDEEGRTAAGWKSIGGRVYYFMDSRCLGYEKEREGEMMTGWRTVSGRRYYFMDENCPGYTVSKRGVLLSGFRDLGGKTYYFMDQRAAGYRDWKRGMLTTGHVTIGGKKYFFSKSGVMAEDKFVTIRGKKYYFSESGTMQRQKWIEVNGRKFYLERSGKVHTGLLRQNGKKYYFGWNGVLVVNRRIKVDGIWYRADADGVLR